MPEGPARRGGARSSADNGIDELKRRISGLEGELREARPKTEEVQLAWRAVERHKELLREARLKTEQLAEEMREDRLKTEQLGGEMREVRLKTEQLAEAKLQIERGLHDERDARLKTEQEVRRELHEAGLQIAELRGHRYRTESRAAEAEEGEKGADADGMGTETKLDTDLQRAATSAANTGQLVLDLDLELDHPVFTNDIAASADNFHRAASVLHSVEMPYPMVHMAPGWAPLDLGNSGETSSWRAGTGAPISPAEIIDLARRAHHEPERVGLRFAAMPVVRARRFFAALLTKFLKTRVEAAVGSSRGADWPKQGTLTVRGLDVTVHTEQLGLRIYYAPLYFPSSSLIFGSPSPVRGYLPPGIYIFGAEGRNHPKLFEPDAPWPIPPNHTVTMLRA
jgi:hypothetical protein